MKNIQICLLAIGLMLLAACSSIERTTYRVYGTTAITAEISMRAWNEWVKAGKATIADEYKVKAAYDKYQASQRIVQDLIKSKLYSKDQLDFACTAVSTAGADVVSLISTLKKGS